MSARRTRIPAPGASRGGPAVAGPTGRCASRRTGQAPLAGFPRAWIPQPFREVSPEALRKGTTASETGSVGLAACCGFLQYSDPRQDGNDDECEACNDGGDRDRLNPAHLALIGNRPSDHGRADSSAPRRRCARDRPASFGTCLVAVRSVRLETPSHDAVQRLRDGWIDLARRRGGLLHPLHELGDGRVATAEIPGADQQIPQNQAERIHVSPLIHHLPGRLLRGHVGERPDHADRSDWCWPPTARSRNP